MASIIRNSKMVVSSIVDSNTIDSMLAGYKTVDKPAQLVRHNPAGRLQARSQEQSRKTFDSVPMIEENPLKARGLHLQSFLISAATLFGIGRFSKMPGTLGTLATIPIVIIFYQLGPIAYMALTFLVVILAIFAAEAFEKAHQTHDPKEVVIDEVAGFLIAMTWLPMTWQALFLSFVLFRLLDIIKPFPIGALDKKIRGGLGVVADDLAAGIIASIILQLMYYHTNWLGAQWH